MKILKNGATKTIGLIPAAGTGSRISPLPCSKEIFPVGFRETGKNRELRPKATVHYLLERIRITGTRQAFIIIGPGKWDIPGYLGNGSRVDMNLGYLMRQHPYGVPFTLDSAFPFIEDKTVVFGFPDIIFYPDKALLCILERLNSSSMDAVLGLFPAENPAKMDMVALDTAGNISSFQIKPESTSLKYTWIIAVWKFSFTTFMHNYVSDHLTKLDNPDSAPTRTVNQEIFMGDVFQAALESRLSIDTVIFQNGLYIDIGTPEDLAIAIQTHSNPLVPPVST